MKAFESWMVKREKYCSSITKPCYPFDYETGWKAALEWVLENFDGKTDILELGFRIRKEMDYE